MVASIDISTSTFESVGSGEYKALSRAGADRLALFSLLASQRAIVDVAPSLEST